MPEGRSVPGTRHVRLLGTPVRLWVSADEHYQDLLREFALLHFGHDAGQSVPARLLALTEELTAEFGGIGSAQSAERDAALASGVAQVDLDYDVPPQIAAAFLRLGYLLDEVKEYCAADQLLVLEAAPGLVEFRRWYLGQFVSQIDGAAPVSWSGPLDFV